MSLASEKNWLSQNTRFYLCHTFLFFFFDFFLFFCIDVFMQCAALFPSISSCSPQKKSPNVLPFHRGSVFQQKTWRLLRTLFFMSRKRQRTSLSLMCNIRISFIRECFKKESVTSKRSLALHLTPVFFFSLLFLLLSLVSLRVCSVVVGLYLVLLTLF